MARPFELVKFNPGVSSHANFVYDSFRRSINVWPFAHMPVQVVMDRLKRELATPGTETKIAHPAGMGDSFIGWYSARGQHNEVVYAFTKYSLRRQGIAKLVLSSMGVRFQQSVFLSFWTPASARIACRPQYELIFDTRKAWDA